MSRFNGREVQRAIQSKASAVSVAALFYLSSALETEAEPAASGEQPTAQQAPEPAPTTQAPPAATPTEATPAPTGTPPSTAEVPLPTVSVEGTKPQPVRQQRAATPAPQAPPAPAAAP